MNILFDHQIFCLQKYGGISRYYCELANNIAGTPEHEANIFAPVYINEYLSVPSVVCPKGIKIQELSGFGRIAAWGIDNALAYAVLKSQRNVDVFHETYYSDIDCCPRSAKRVTTIHDMIYEKFPDQFPNKNRMRKAKALAAQRADHVICVSENTRNDVVDLLGVSKEKTSVVYHGHSFGGDREGTPFLAKKPYILFVGRRQGYKNFDALLNAYAQSSRLSKTHSLICFGGGRFSGEEVSSIKSLGVSQENVRQMSGDDDLLFELYAGADVFVYPSLYEGFGIPLLEAMASGCPVICSDTSSFPEVAGDAAYFFDPTEEDALGEAIEAVVFSNECRNALVQRGKERVKQFTWGKCAKETVNVYELVSKAKI